MVELMWDGLQLASQLDIAVNEAREAKCEEYLTADFKAALHASNRNKESRNLRHTQDKLLHHKLNAFVQEESNTDNKLSKVVKARPGGSRSVEASSPRRTFKKNDFRASNKYRKDGGKT